MDVTNSSGQDTQYRLGHGGAQSGAQLAAVAGPAELPLRRSPGALERSTSASPTGPSSPGPSSIPRALVELVKDGEQYKVRAMKVAA